ncbi:hypothetical protein EG68_00567 [Paragonimus skrjabini miyazakii]|uniref:Ig-like domain-containing protein n=1 Tax=Paragonimus skrjabini miyazakii TaxID=59628 RepID=A0A8S9Z4H4_9TREM|nr:hypothetical protein EG68_00567 [Paragonimus skrjabini miyazakii]
MVFLPDPIRSQFTQPGLCDMHCHCPPGEPVVDCNRQDKLQGVPTNIPRSVTKLYIQDGDFPSPSYLTRANMTGLEQVEYLSIIYCNLQAIESKAFLGMTKLKHLDLSRNALRRLDTYTFFGLQLINLYLQEQHNLTEAGLQISEDAFDGLTTDQINLRGNKISVLRYKTFVKVNNLHRLILSDNRIRQVDDGFSQHFNQLSYLLDLTGNPLECSCKLAWIAALSNEWANSLPGLNMTCIYYHSLQRSIATREHTVFELRRLSADHLCPRSRIQHIEVSVLDAASRVILDCTAVAIPRIPYSMDLGPDMFPVPSLLSHSPPEVAWQYVEGGQLREVRRLPTEEKVLLSTSAQVLNASTLGLVSSTVRLNVSLNEELGQYKCTTRNDHRDSEEVVVTVRGPAKSLVPDKDPRLPKLSESNENKEGRKSSEFSEKSKLLRTDLTFSEPHYLLQPQFSLVQMALAVGGTFLATLIVLFVGAQCLNACHQHTTVPLSSSVSSMNSPDAKATQQTRTMASRLETRSPEGAFSSPKQNGYDSKSKENGPLLVQHQALNAQQLPKQIFLSGIDNCVAMSPQFSHIANLSNHYIPPTLLPPTQPSSSSGTEELPASLAHLVSSPLLSPSSAFHPVLTMDGALSPHLANIRPGQSSLAYWPVSAAIVAPGSPYSVAGSHVYDVPQAFKLPAYAPGVTVSTINRSSMLSQNEFNGGDFRANHFTGTAL